MKQTLSRRQFLRGAIATTVAVSLGFVQQAVASPGSLGTSAAAENSFTPLALSDIEQWLFSTAQDDLGPDLLSIFATGPLPQVYLPLIGR